MSAKSVIRLSRLDPPAQACRPACPAGVRPPRSQALGIALPAMIFLMVVVGLAMGAGLQLLTRTEYAQIIQLRSAQGMAVARTGSDWGLAQVLDPDLTISLPADALPGCFAATTLSLPATLADWTLTVNCQRFPSSGTTDEGGLKMVTYQIVAEATAGALNQPDYAVRRHEVRYTRCRNPGGLGPAYAC